VEPGGVISRVGNIVFCPEARKMPPPTRLGREFSRAALASLKVRGWSGWGEAGTVDAGSAGCEDFFESATGGEVSCDGGFGASF